MAAFSKFSSHGEDVTSQRKRWPLVLATLCGSIALATLIVAFPFVKPAFRRICLPYVPATDNQVANIITALKTLHLQPASSSVVDLGSGDGRLVLAAAKLGFKSTGVELNPWLVYWSRLTAWKSGLRAEFLKKDLFTVDLSLYNVIIIFGVDSMMGDIEKMILQSHSNTFSVIACRFPLPSAVPITTVGQGIDTVWIYSKPLQVKQT